MTISHYVGLDVHKDSIVVSCAQTGTRKPRQLGTVAYSAKAVLDLLKTTNDGHFDDTIACYEAGPTGYGLQRKLNELGLKCFVVAPAKVPQMPGDRVKTDRKDAAKLARYLRSGDLTEVHVPDEQTEAVRDLVRCREAAKRAEKKAKQHIRSFLLRHDRRFTGKTAWSKAHLEWIRRQKFTHPASEAAFADYLHALRSAGERVERLTKAVGAHVEEWDLAPVVKALQAFRGVSLLTAATIVSEIGDMSRFKTAPQLMSYLGIVPSERSSGLRRIQGGITKTGNSRVRRVLVEAAWAYRFNARTSPELKRRQQGVSKEVRDIAWTAQARLCARYRRLQGRGKSSQVVITAIARELAGFLWAAAQQPRLLAA